MPAECSNSDAHPMEDWDVVDLNDLPCPEKVLPNGNEMKVNTVPPAKSLISSAAKVHSPMSLPRSSGSVGSRSLFSTLALRVARVFSVSNTSVSRGSLASGGELAASSDREFNGSMSIINASWDRRRHNSGDPQSSNRPRQLLVSDLSNYMDHCGCITMRTLLKRDVFERGIDASIRPMVWPILLGVYPPAMSQNERVAWLKKRSNEYLHLRSEWQNLLVDHHGSYQQQESRSQSRSKSRGGLTPPSPSSTCNLDTSYLRSIVTAVRKDAIRTDRTHRMFNAEDSPWTTAMFNLLVTYAFAHPSVGYCQGMSDLAAPLLVVMRDEASAYVCFCALMVRMRRHFSPSDDSSIASKFTVLALLLRHYCPRLHRFLVSQGADDLLFAYRWLFLEMKREFPLDECLRMLEVIWAAVPDQYLPSTSVELPLAETDYRRRAAVLTGETASSNAPGGRNNSNGSDSEPTISEPPLFDASTTNPTPPRRLISCATAARCGSQYFLDGHGGFRHSTNQMLQSSSSMLHIPVAPRTISDCTSALRIHPSSYAAVTLASSGDSCFNRFRSHNRTTPLRQSGGATCCCQPTPSFQRLITRGFDETNGGNRSAPLPITSRLSGSSNRGRRPLRKRRTSFPPPSSSLHEDESSIVAKTTPKPALLAPIESNASSNNSNNLRQTDPIYEAQLDTTATDDSAVCGGGYGIASQPPSCSESNIGIRRDAGSSNVTTESEAEQVNRDGLATASSSAEYDASSEYGGDEEELGDDDGDADASSASSSLMDKNGGLVSETAQLQQQPATILAVAMNGSSEACGSSTAEMTSVTTTTCCQQNNQATNSSPFSNLPSTPLNASNNSSAALATEPTVDADLTQCSQAEEAILATNDDNTMDDTCEIATEAILSPSLNPSPSGGATENRENSHPPLTRFASFASSTVSSNSHYQADSGLLATTGDLVTSEDEDVELPTMHELGDSPFVVFVALTLLLQHRGKLLDGHKDYNEIHIYFDKLVRKHNAEAVLMQARRIYNAFINGKSAGSGGSSSNNGGFGALFGMRRTKRQKQQKKEQVSPTSSVPTFANNQSEPRDAAHKDNTSDKSRRSSP